MKRIALFGALLLATPACTLDTNDVLDVPANIDEIRTYFNGNNALVYTRDAQNTTGAAAIVSLDAPFRVLETGISQGGWFSNDVMLQGDSRYVYIIDRTNGNVTVIDPLDGAAELKQISVGPTSNPKSVVRIDGKLYVTRWNESSVLVIDAQTYAEVGTVDLSEFADADGTPEMGLAVTAAGRVWVALERYDQLNYWAPSTLPVDGAYLVSIDPATDKLDKRVKLNGVTPYQMLKVDPLTGDLLVISSQNYAAGIEAVDPATGTAKGWLVEPATFSEGIFFAEATTTHVYVVSGEGAHNGAPDWDWDYAVLWAVDRKTGEKAEVYRTAEGYMGLACLELSPGTTRVPDARLLVTCAGPSVHVTHPGLRIFDPATRTQLTKAPLDTGLPPFGVAFFARPETEVVSVPATSATLP